MLPSIWGAMRGWAVPSQRYMIEVLLPEKAISESDFFPFWMYSIKKDPWTAVIYLILLLLGIWIIYRVVTGSKRRAAEKEKQMEQTRQNAQKANETFTVQRILPNDPSFSLEHFLNVVNHTATIIQDAWSSGDMNKARNFISSGVYNRFRIQLKMMMEQEKVKNIVRDYQVLSIQLIHEEITGDYYALHLKITDKARDVTVSVEAGENEIATALKSATPSEFTQVYSFLRKKNIQTDPAKSFLNNVCPSCGAAIDNQSDKAKCPYCGNVFNSGDHDWVLAEITQWSEWDISRRKKIAEDNAIHPQVLEDRVSYLFWQYLYARSVGRKDILQRHCTQEFLQRYDLKKTFYTEPVIGSVDLSSITKTADGLSQANLVIKWSAGIDKNEPQNRTTRIGLICDMTTYGNPGFGGAACPSCGAPLPDDYKNNCEFCGAGLPATSQDWLIHQMEE